jgi:hypothetical protein
MEGLTAVIDEEAHTLDIGLQCLDCGRVVAGDDQSALEKGI